MQNQRSLHRKDWKEQQMLCWLAIFDFQSEWTRCSAFDKGITSVGPLTQAFHCQLDGYPWQEALNAPSVMNDDRWCDFTKSMGVLRPYGCTSLARLSLPSTALCLARRFRSPRDDRQFHGQPPQISFGCRKNCPIFLPINGIFRGGRAVYNVKRSRFHLYLSNGYLPEESKKNEFFRFLSGFCASPLCLEISSWH